MASFKKLSRQWPSSVVQSETPESRYWRKFQQRVTVKEFAAVSCVDFSPSTPHDFAVTSGSRIQIFSSATNQVKKTISRFQETVHSAHFREDGKLLVGGGEEGVVKVFDLGSRAILRQCSGHTKAVRCTCFTPDGLRILSTADDTTLRTWDLSTGDQLGINCGHKDYVRSLATSSTSPDICATGSYDHTVKIWDLRVDKADGPVASFDHGAPVEALLFLPSGVCVSAGENQMCVWDSVSSRRLFSFSNHQKTITCLALDHSGRRLLSGGIDRQIKVYDVVDYSVVHSLSCTAAVLSLGLSPADTHLVVGMADGTVSVRKRQVKSESDDVAVFREQEPRPGTRRFFTRGQDVQPREGDMVVNIPRHVKLRPYENLLRHFRHSEALDEALRVNEVDIVISMLQELIHREALKAALSGRDDKELEPLLLFLTKFVTNPSYTAVLVDVTNFLLDLYSGVAGQSPLVGKLLLRLKARVENEVNARQQLQEVHGMLDMLFTISRKRNT